MKKTFVVVILSLLACSGFAQNNKRFSKPKETSTRNQQQQGHLIDQNTYEFDKDNQVKLGDTLLVGSPSGPVDFEFIAEKKGLLGFANIDKIKNLVGDVSSDAGNAINKAQNNDVTYKARNINRDINALKGASNLKFSDQAKKLMNKKLVVTKFEEKDYGDGVKDVIATAVEGKKKYLIVLTSALLEHEIYLSN